MRSMKSFLHLPLLVAALSSAQSFGVVCDVTPTPDGAVYALAPVADSTAASPVDATTTGRGIVIGKGRNENLVMSYYSTNGSGKCRSKWDGTAWVTDARFYLNSGSNGGGNVVGMTSDNTKDSKILMAYFPLASGATVPAIATKYSVVEDVGSSTCAESDGTTVTYYRKLCLCVKSDCSAAREEDN